MSLLALLECLGCMAHPREGEQRADSIGFADGRAFFGEMARQAVEATAREVFTTSALIPRERVSN